MHPCWRPRNWQSLSAIRERIEVSGIKLELTVIKMQVCSAVSDGPTLIVHSFFSSLQTRAHADQLHTYDRVLQGEEDTSDTTDTTPATPLRAHRIT